MMRKMWAGRGWEKHAGNTYVTKERVFKDDLPIAVMSAEGMPDFGPGDRVTRGDMVGTVLMPPYRFNGMWYMNVDDGCPFPCTWQCEGTTKVPTEKTVLLRITGQADGVEGFIQFITKSAPGVADVIRNAAGVRVERVEDDD